MLNPFGVLDRAGSEKPRVALRLPGVIHIEPNWGVLGSCYYRLNSIDQTNASPKSNPKGVKRE